MKLLVTGGAGFLEYGVTLGFEKCLEQRNTRKTEESDKCLVDKSKGTIHE